MTDDHVADLRRELERTARRLSDLGTVRLARPAAPAAASPADAAFALVQHLADRCADHLGEPRRDVPRLGDHAVADQLRVVGQDLIDAVTSAPTPAERSELKELRAEIAAVARALP